MADPRDPRRRATRPINESLDEVASGLSVFIQGQESVMAELLQTQKEIRVRLNAQERPGADRSTARSGIPGLAPPPPSPESVAAAARWSSPEAPLPDGLATPGSRSYHYRPAQPREIPSLTDFQIDGASGQYANQTRKGLRNNVYANIAARAENAEQEIKALRGPGTMSDMQGNRRSLREGVSWSATGGGTGAFNPETGEFDLGTGAYIDKFGNHLSAEDATEFIMGANGERHLVRKAAALNVGKNVAQSYAGGAPIGRALMSAAPAGLLKGLGVGGIAYAAGNKVWESAQNQYAENRKMQGIYGDRNRDQYSRRLSDWWDADVAGRFSLLGSGSYRELLNSGRGLGQDGDDLDRYVETGANLMGQGVGDQETSGLLKMVIEAGQSLSGLEESIRGVNEAARDAGINAGRAREVFQKNYEASSDLMFGSGAGRARFAGSITEAQMSQGRQYQGVDSVMGGLRSDSIQRLVAFNNDMTPSELALQRQKSPGVVAAMTEEAQRNVMSNAPRSNLNGVPLDEIYDAYIAEYGSYDPTFDQDNLGNFVLRQGYDEAVLQMMLQQMGITTTAALAPGVVGNLFSPESGAQKALLDEAEYAGQLRRGFTGDDLEFVEDEYGNTAAKDEAGLMKEYIAGAGGAKNDEESGYGLSTWDLDSSSRLGAVETLIGQHQSLGMDGDKTIVRVRTKDGHRAVTLAEALRYYPDQIQSGEAVIVDGASDDAINTSVGTILSIPESVAEEARSAAGYSANSTAEPDVGQEFGEWREEYEEERKGENKSDGGGTLRLELTPAASKLLDILNEDGSYYEPEAGPIDLDGG